MKVNLIKEQTIKNYAKKHPSNIKSFQWWLDIIGKADWDRPDDITNTFASADLLGKSSERVVFDIGGNNHRLICSYRFNNEIDTATFFVKWIGTHAEYDKLCEDNLQYTAENHQDYN